MLEYPELDGCEAAQGVLSAPAEAENNRRRERATMDFIAATMAKLDETYDQVPPSGSEEIARFLKKASVNGSSQFNALRNYLNYLEDLAVGVNLGLFDLEILSRTIGPRMIRAWESYSPWIERERVSLKFPGLCSDLEQCVATIRRVREQPRMP